MKMSKDDIRTLKEKHRIELIMQEFGERFEIKSGLWHSVSTRGLIVNVDQQTYEYQQPGTDKEIGDVFGWLKLRLNFSFKMAIAYLQKRDPSPDTTQPIQPEAANVEDAHASGRLMRSMECMFPDEEKDASGLYERGVSYHDGRTYYVYSLKPIDHWQERALEIGGEEIRNYFALPLWKLNEILELQFHRFIPIQDTWIDSCDLCEKSIKWWWEQKPNYAYQEEIISDCNASAWKRVQIIQEPQVYAFITHYPGDDEEVVVCEDCKRKSESFSSALNWLCKSAYKREAPERERARQEMLDAWRKQDEERVRREELESLEFEQQEHLQPSDTAPPA